MISKRQPVSVWDDERLGGVGRARRSVPASLVVLGVMAFGWGGWVGAAASPVPDYDFDWAVIGSPGNRGVTIEEAPFFAFESELYPLGAVSYEYRISKDKVTIGQWFEFVQAYAPHYTGLRSNRQFTGYGVGVAGSQTEAPFTYQLSEAFQNYPVEAGFGYIQRYINWLHNDKGTELEDFEQGVYDMNLGYFDTTPAADARFRLPTLDEWTKAVYYDPNRYGEGVDGYWLYPNGTNEPLISGVPGVGQTSAGYMVQAGLFSFEIRSYPDQITPWGLFDASGGVEEYIQQSVSRGTRAGELQWEIKDRLDGYLFDVGLLKGEPWTGGFRVVSVVPAPGGVLSILVGGVFTLLWREKRWIYKASSRL